MENKTSEILRLLGEYESGNTQESQLCEELTHGSESE